MGIQEFHNIGLGPVQHHQYPALWLLCCGCLLIQVILSSWISRGSKVLRAECYALLKDAADGPRVVLPYGVLWVARSDRQACKLSKTKSSSVVPEVPFGLDKDVQHRDMTSSLRHWTAAALLQQRPTKNTVSIDTVLSSERQLLLEAFPGYNPVVLQRYSQPPSKYQVYLLNDRRAHNILSSPILLPPPPRKAGVDALVGTFRCP